MQEEDDQQLALDQYLLDAASLTQPDEVRDSLERGANPNARRPQGYDSSTREGEGDWGDNLSQERGVGGRHSSDECGSSGALYLTCY